MLVGWLKLRGRLRPWMLAVALAAGGAAGCGKGSTGPGEGTCGPGSTPLAPPCVEDDECRARFGAGWVCRPEPTRVLDGCGRWVEWGRLCASELEDPGPEGRAARAAAALRSERADGAGRSGASSADDVDRMVYGVRMPDPEPVGGNVQVFWTRIEPVGGSGHLSAQDFTDSLRMAFGAIQAEYYAIFAADPAQRGTVSVRLTVQPGGGVTATVEASDPGLRKAGLPQRMTELLRATSFGANSPIGGPVEVRLQAEFLPPEAASE